MNENYIYFFNNIITFQKFIEIRIFGVKSYPIMKYAQNMEELQKYIKLHNRSNLYCSINPRVTKSGKSINVSYRKNIFFDIEGIKNKPVLTDLGYYNKLKDTINYISKLFNEKYGMNVNCVVKSGRGMHVYFTIQNLDNKYQIKYIKWYNEIVKFINENSPYHNEIKCDPPVKDLPRIAGLPGTINWKYPEKPVREIVYINEKINTGFESVLDNIKETKTKMITEKRTIKKCGNKKRYTNADILDAPEFQVWKFKPKQGTSLNNILRLVGKLLIDRDSITDTSKISEFIQDCGYPWKEMNFDRSQYPDYEYSESILNKYVIHNMQWSVNVGFKLPYKLFEEKVIDNSISHIEIDYDTEFIGYNINTLNDLIGFIKVFNKKYCDNRVNNGMKYYTKALEQNIEINIKSEILRKFIEFNNLIERLKYII